MCPCTTLPLPLAAGRLGDERPTQQCAVRDWRGLHKTKDGETWVGGPLPQASARWLGGRAGEGRAAADAGPGPQTALFSRCWEWQGPPSRNDELLRQR